MNTSSLSPELKLRMYEGMCRCRKFEERVYYLFLEGRLPGTVHQSQGQEACAVGVCSALGPNDMITSTHRPHSHAVARGLALRALMSELFARTTGCCHGKGGSMHVGDPELGMLPAIAIVGGGVPIAAGLGLAFRRLRKPNVVACFFGEGATNTGAFHEGVNLAAVWDLPVVFVCENNKYAASTSVDKVMKAKLVSDRAASYGIPAATLNGNDVEAVYAATSQATERARTGGGPTLLELETYRFAGHSRSDPGNYRPKQELSDWKQRDPIVLYEEKLVSEGLLSNSRVRDVHAQIEQEIEDAIRFAEGSPHPAPEDCLTDVFA